MREKEAYIKVLLDLIFSEELRGDLAGYQDMDPEWLKLFPINNQVNNFMKKMYMKTIQDNGNTYLIYSGDKSWWYDFWNVDNILDIIDGNLTFSISIDGEVDDELKTFPAVVEIKNYTIYNIFISDDYKDVYIIKNGKINGNNIN